MRSSYSFAILFFSATLAVAQLTNATTEVTCGASFAWMSNSKQQSPCLAAAIVDAFCSGGHWDIPAIPDSKQQYSNPNTANGTATFCTCSWTNYNLLSACTACQNIVPIPYNQFVSECGSLAENDTFFPKSNGIPPDTAIPAWAQQNPNTAWMNGIFNPNQAQAIANQKLPDATSADPAPAAHKKTNVGAIVGGVIGGLVVIVGAVCVALWMMRRQRKPVVLNGPTYDQPGHMRSTSDLSMASHLKSNNGGYASLGNNRQMAATPQSPTAYTHNSSVLSVPFTSVTVPQTYSSPPISRQGASTPGHGPEIIHPYTLPPTVDNPDRKQSNGGFPIPVFDPPTAPHPAAMRIDNARPQTPTNRIRYNPPTYAASTAGSTSGQRPPHRKQLSTDTQHSLTSSRNGPSHNPSGSGIPEIVDEVDLPPPPHEEHQTGHGRQVSTSRDEKRQQRDTLSASDIA